MRQMLRILFVLWTATCLSSVAWAADPPVAMCNNVTVEADANCSAMASIDDGSYDPGGGILTLIQVPAGPYPLGETVVKLIVVAESGLADTCEATVTVVDMTPPTVICPADIVVDNEPGQCGAYVSYDITATDNCSIVSPLGKQGASFYSVGVTIITPVVTDASGNEGTCSFKVIVKDTERPTINCPADIVQGTDPDICGALVNYVMSSSDNCPGVTISSDHPSGSIFPMGVTMVWLKAKDASGNQDSCSFTVTINDTQKPIIACPADMDVDNDAGMCGATVNYDVTATDDCDPNPNVVVTPLSGSFLPIGVSDVVAIATDASGNTETCVFKVTVHDVEKPAVTCPADVMQDNDPDQCGAIVTFTVDATDNCAGVMAAANPPSGAFFPIGITTVTAIATDLAGNEESCQFTVTINDIQKPTAICPGPIEQNNDPAQCSAVVNFDVSATDNCSGSSAIADPPSGSSFPIGTTSVVVVATDIAGLEDTCFFDVTVNDTEKPAVICPANIAETVAQGDTGKVVNFDVSATDN
ncbi:MAG: HYR domain-containing protein, partial [Candidatus Zixiibacteriota bacterium]